MPADVVSWAPGREGYYGDFGGAFVPEMLHETLAGLRAAFDIARHDPAFWKSYVEVMKTYAGRPTAITYCDNLTRRFGGARIYVKREDLNHTGSPSETGMSGFILPDLPPEEAAELNAVARGRELHPILIMTPTNSSGRLAEIGRQASGFVYCIARKGVTGRKTDISQGVEAFLERCRMATSLPLGLGFGIGTAVDMREVRGMADIAIVGTAGLDAWEARGADGYLQFLEDLAAETV